MYVYIYIYIYSEALKFSYLLRIREDVRNNAHHPCLCVFAQEERGVCDCYEGTYIAVREITSAFVSIRRSGASEPVMRAHI